MDSTSSLASHQNEDQMAVVVKDVAVSRDADQREASNGRTLWLGGEKGKKRRGKNTKKKRWKKKEKKK